MEVYNRFEHTIADRSDKLTLVSLKFEGFDWGYQNRFLQPIISPDHTKAFTYEIKFAPALSQQLAKTGWNRRGILIDLTSNQYQADSWEQLPYESFQLKSDWKKLGFFWKNSKNFSSPQIDRTWSSILEVDDQSIKYKNWDKDEEIKWGEIQKIHFSKRSVNTLEVPNLEPEIRSQDYNNRVTLPQDAGHEFYQQLQKRKLITSSELTRFLQSEKDTELSVTSTLGSLIIPIEESFDQIKSQQGIFDGDKLISWLEVDKASPVIAKATIGNLTIENLKVDLEEKDHDKFPINTFFFSFSKVNKATTHEDMVRQISQWLKNPNQIAARNFTKTGPLS